MLGKIHWDKNGKRYRIQIYINSKRHIIWRDPVKDVPFREKWQAEHVREAIRYEVEELGKDFNINQWKPRRPLAFENYSRGWLEDKAENVSVKTLQGYRTAIIKYAIPHFGDADIRKIRAKKIRQFKESLPLSEKGIYNVVGAVKTMFKDAYADEVIDRVPPFPKLSQGQNVVVEYLTIEQQDKIIDAIPAHDKPIFSFGMEYGLRVQEVRALKKDCIDGNEVTIKRKFAENELEETVKTGDLGVRTFRLTAYASKVLKSIERHLGPFVFVRKDGKPYTNKNLNTIWSAACSIAGISIKLQNAMRHSLGCQLLDNGESLETVRQIYGHTNIKMTMRYTRRRVTENANQALENRRGKVVLLKKKE